MPQAHSVWPSGVWTGSSHGHVLVGRGHRVLWQARGRFAREYEVDMVALGRNALAFSYGWRKPALYVARLGGADRRVGQGGLPLGWTSAGLYTHRGRALRLLGSEGAVRATIAHHVVHVAFDAIGHGIWYVAGGALFWAHEPSVRRIAHVRR